VSAISAVVKIGAAQTHRILWVLAALWCGAILTAPIAELESAYSFFSAICHQMADRSMYLDGHPLPVCIRCAWIYFGLLLALSLRFEPRTWLLRLSLVAMGLEFVIARLWIDWEVTRALSGLLVGLAAAGFVEIGIRELLTRQRPEPPAPPAGHSLEKAPGRTLESFQ
jgi:uncharacterized membrane protein